MTISAGSDADTAVMAWLPQRFARSTNAVVVTNRDVVIVHVNETFLRLYGYERDAVQVPQSEHSRNR